VYFARADRRTNNILSAWYKTKEFFRIVVGTLAALMPPFDINNGYFAFM
jgi:hypothetical protein